MRMPNNLWQLHELRKLGKSPVLPVFVVGMKAWIFHTNMESMGALSIRVRPEDAKQDWQALAGLDVIIHFPEIPAWRDLMHAIRDSKPRRLRTLSERGLTTMWGPLQ